LQCKTSGDSLDGYSQSCRFTVRCRFPRSMDPCFSQDLDTFSERILLVTNKLFNLVPTVDQSQGILGKGKGKLASQDDIVDNFHLLLEKQ
jgi:hypothetical protein